MRSRLHRVIVSPLLLAFPLTLPLLALMTCVVNGQVLELRHVFEQYHDFKVQAGGWMIGPSLSRVNPATAEVSAGDTAFHFYQYLSVDYSMFRVGMVARGTSVLAPFVRFSPVMPPSLGGANSPWSFVLSWEGNYVQSGADDPEAALQPDNSVYSPRNSISMLLGYWAWTTQDSSTWLANAVNRCPDVPLEVIRQWGQARRASDWNWSGHGAVDTFDFTSFPLDTNSYVRGMVIPTIHSSTKTSRQGFSAALGLGSGKYAGSGPLSGFLNIGGKETDDAQRRGALFEAGFNPIAAARYRIGDFIAQLDVAGEDLNLGLIVRSFGAVDIETGVKYLEHSFPRSTRGPSRSEFFLAVRYAPTIALGSASYERGEGDTYGFGDDSDNDGLPDDIERSIVGSDPHVADTDGDGIIDGIEVITYRTDPTRADSDGDGISDGDELMSTPRTDPLRADTDGDGFSDSEERQNGTDPLVPSGGERGK